MRRPHNLHALCLPTVLLAACGFWDSSPSPTPGGPKAPCGSRGASGVVQVYHLSEGKCEALDQQAIAAGGAEAVLIVSGTRTDQKSPLFAKVRSSRPEVATFRTDPAYKDFVLARSGESGTADLIFSDAQGNDIDRVTVLVAPTRALKLDVGWGEAAGPTLLAGVVRSLHFTTLDGDKVLHGAGAVKYATTGPLVTLPPEVDDLYRLALGDTLRFGGTRGSGTITASCPEASLSLPVTIAGPEDITDARLAPTSLRGGGDVEVVVLSGDQPVYGATCAWAVPAGVVLPTRLGDSSTLSSERLGASAATRYHFTRGSADYTAVCTLPGGLTVDLPVSR